MLDTNIMTGWITPEMNCALNDAANTASLRVSNSSRASCWRPNTLTTSWPVKTSSMWPLSRPVLAHCFMNSGCDLLVTALVMANASGSVSRATSDSSGEMTSIMTSVPMTMRIEVSSWLMVCWNDWAMLSMSLVVRESTSPRSVRSK